jgi:hypothetical protein
VAALVATANCSFPQLILASPIALREPFLSLWTHRHDYTLASAGLEFTAALITKILLCGGGSNVHGANQG